MTSNTTYRSTNEFQLLKASNKSDKGGLPVLDGCGGVRFTVEEGNFLFVINVFTKTK